MVRSLRISPLVRCRCTLFLMLAVMYGLITGGSIQSNLSASNSTEVPEVVTLTNHEAAKLRKHVYKGLGTYIDSNGPWPPHRIVAVPIPVSELHQRKRLATLRLLLDIVKGGRPEDALTAAAYAVALEENPLRAVLLADYPLDAVDDDAGEMEQSGRARLIVAVTKLIINVKKKP